MIFAITPVKQYYSKQTHLIIKRKKMLNMKILFFIL